MDGTPRTQSLPPGIGRVDQPGRNRRIQGPEMCYTQPGKCGIMRVLHV